ncbi:MAG TPA: hypothetical protein VF701_11960 [Thermoanaerobaculia bacterium]
MVRNRHERGEGQLGCLIGLVLLLAAGLVAYKVIPIKVKAAEMRDVVIDEARSAGQNRDPQIMKAILNRAKHLELPVTEDNVSIVRGSGMIRIDVKYTLEVDFPGYTYVWNFHHKAENPLF